MFPLQKTPPAFSLAFPLAIAFAFPFAIALAFPLALIAVGGGTGVAASAVAAKWRPKTAPLMTRWAAQVDPQNPLPEYPRPQMVRDQWLNLNGIWEWQPAEGSPAFGPNERTFAKHPPLPAEKNEKPPFGKTLSSLICVPFGMESALSGVMRHHDRLWYRRTFTLPENWRGKNILLHFEAVDWESEVYVNGQSAGIHQGGYDPFSYDITKSLKPDGENELIVRVFDPTEWGGQPRGKQSVTPGALKYTATTGIWQTVWLEPVEQNHITHFLFNPDIDKAQLAVTVNLAKPAADAAGAIIEITVKDGGKPVASVTTTPDTLTPMPIPTPKLWSPDSPFLYDVELQLKQNGKTLDRLTSYFGMRKHSIGMINGQVLLLLNNKPLLQKGTLDQGYWPDGIYTAPTDEALRFDIEAHKAMGFNMARKHVKIEPRRWYHWCDKLGLLVWQDLPMAYTRDGGKKIPPPDTAAITNDLRRMVLTHRNAPSIVQWVIFNEGQSQKFFDDFRGTEKLVKLIRDNDPTPRTIDEGSGGRNLGFADISDIHTYPEPSAPPPNGKQALVNGEYGGIGWLLPKHSWAPKGGGKINVSSSDDLYYLYAELLAQVKVLNEKHALSGCVYTQLTDTETEVNGLLFYDRVPKFPIEKIRAANEFRVPRPACKDLLPLSQTAPQTWKYTFDEPASPTKNAWAKPRYDDSTWREGTGGFGANADCVGTNWPGKKDLWLRKKFRLGALPPDELKRTVATLYCIGLMGEVYINGVPFKMQHTASRILGGTLEYRQGERI
jgi:hypothetical protein